jgi:hypothetical protein
VPFSHYRVRNDKVDKVGKITLRYGGRLRHINVGRAHARERVLVLVADRDVRWLLGVVVALVLLAIVLPLALSVQFNRPASLSSTTNGDVSALTSLAKEYQRSMNAAAKQGVPYAAAINAADTDASTVTATWQQDSTQIEQEMVASYDQSTNPSSASSRQELQCVASAGSLTDADQMESAIDQCLQQEFAQANQYSQELTQDNQEMLSQLQEDATKASGAYAGLERSFVAEATLTAKLPLPPRLADSQEQVLTALGSVTRDAVAGEAVVGEPVPALAVKMSADVSVLDDQIESLVAAMRLQHR